MRPRALLAELPPYVPGERLPGGIKLSSNENPRGPSPMAVAALRAALGADQAREGACELHRYPDGGASELRRALAGRSGVEESMVVVGNGSDEIMVMAAGAFVEPGRNAVTAAHTFSQYAFATRLFGGEVRVAPMDEGKFDLGATARLVDRQTSLVWFCNPNNPTAAVIDRDELEAFLEGLPPHVLVVVDEAYAEYCECDAFPDTLALVRRGAPILRLRTFSKIYGLAALRVGYGIASAQVAAQLARVRQPFNVGTVAQLAALAALDDQQFVRSTVRLNATERERLQDYLRARGVDHYRSYANFVCARLGAAAPTVHERLRERGISVRPLGSFGLRDHLRISTGTTAEMDALYRELDRILPDCGFR